MSDIDIVCVATTGDQARVRGWRQTLEAEGIACEVGEQLTVWFNNVSGAQADLWVHRANAQRARELLCCA